MQIDKLQSEAINFLRFPLIVGVVFIHNYSPIAFGGEVMVDAPFFHVFSELFSQVIGRVVVPLFFFISGFLFFYRTNFNAQVYTTKLKKRIRSLLIPYLFWNISFLVFYYVVTHIPAMSSWFKGVDYSWEYILSSLWGRLDETGTAAYPVAYQFWFIRDLMVAVVLTPLLYVLLKYSKGYFVLLLGLLWFWGFSIPYLGIRGFSMSALFFFAAGTCLGIYRLNILEVFGHWRKFSFGAYPLLALVDLCTKGTSYNVYIHQAGILVGIVFCFNLTAWLLKDRKVKTSAFLSSASFFVFAIHDPWLLSQIRKILTKVLTPDSDGMWTLLYFLNVILTVGIALLLYALLKRMLPRFTRLITGGR